MRGLVGDGNWGQGFKHEWESMQGLGLLKYEDQGLGITCEKIGKKDLSESFFGFLFFLVFIYLFLV